MQFRLILHLKAQDLFDNQLNSFFEILIRRLLGAMSTFGFFAAKSKIPSKRQ
jgi:hypothetical protein